MKPVQIPQFFRQLNVRQKLAFICLPLAAVLTLMVARGDVTYPSNPVLNLSSEPLFARGTRDKPTLTFSMSVEFPTVGAQYLSSSSSVANVYDPTQDYIGYYDHTACYKYNDDPQESIPSGLSKDDYRRFDRVGAAAINAGYDCQGKNFSGNFLNWATSSAIDILRMALTGGDRYIDTADGLTILQRAVIPSNFYSTNVTGGDYFPAKQLLNNATRSKAVPTSLYGTTTGTIYIANCLNRVYFGTAATGSCDSPGNNGNLGAKGATNDSSELASTQKYFFTRVSVCGSTGGTLQDTRTYDNAKYCALYPNGKYKPVGNFQNYSDAMRVAVLGYLNESGTARYGGVLRAPMKYVGPKWFDSSGVEQTTENPQAEWDTQTGVIKDNPIPTYTSGSKTVKTTDYGKYSGAINYINRFGRTKTAGNYKTNDPVAELYYEALRYIQGLPPTTGSGSNKTDAYVGGDTYADGFPYYPAWNDPLAAGDPNGNYQCLKNNIFTVGDIGTHADTYIPGASAYTWNPNDVARLANPANNEPDFAAYTALVGAFEAGSSLAYIDNSGTSRTTSNPNSTSYYGTPWSGAKYTSTTDNLSTKATGAGTSGYFLAGMAYWAKNYDIRPSKSVWSDATTNKDGVNSRPGARVTSYFLDVNQNNSSGYGVGDSKRRTSSFFLAAKYGGFNDVSGKGSPYVTSTGTLDNSIWDKSNSNYFNPTRPGEAGTHFIASDSLSILKNFNKVFATIAQDGRSIAGGAISTQRLTSVGGFVYQAEFKASDWTGDLISQFVTVDKDNNVSVSDGVTSPNQWYASDQLDKLIAAKPDASTRNIVVGRRTGTTTTASKFLWDSLDASTQQSALNKPTPSSSSDGQGENRVNFLRGVRTLEGTTVTSNGVAFAYRKRGGLLGDIINSGVAYSGVPSGGNTGSDYVSFYQSIAASNNNKGRTPALFVGANDGMLHAFDATNGNELFAYIPSWLVPKLPALTAANYDAGGHQSYLDGSPVVAEAKVGSDWKTVLVSGTGNGGQGVFGLDVTDPTKFDTTKVMWEFTDQDDADMGNVIGRPQILKFRTSAASSKTPTYKYFAAVPSGVNNYANDSYRSTTGRPALFLLDLSKGPSSAWAEGTNYFKISLPAGSASLPTGLANFTTVTAYTGEVSMMYMGDLQGNLWKLDFSVLGINTSDLASPDTGANLNKLSPFKTTAATPTAIPLFIAKDKTSSAVVQPITAAPALTRGPSGGIVIAFGTGKYLESADNVVTSSTQTQSIYSVLDNGVNTADTSGGSSIISSRARLKAGSVTITGANSGTIDTPTFNWGRAASDSDTVRSGWYIDYPTSGERQISAASIFGTKLIFGSVIPPNSVTDPCGSGNGYQYYVDVLTGDGSRSFSTIGLLGEPFVLELGLDKVGAADATGKRLISSTGQIILQGSQGIKAVVGDGAGGSSTKTVSGGRTGWRQINNYSDLHYNATH